jgi:hypothetical protein
MPEEEERIERIMRIVGLAIAGGVGIWLLTQIKAPPAPPKVGAEISSIEVD